MEFNDENIKLKLTILQLLVDNYEDQKILKYIDKEFN